MSCGAAVRAGARFCPHCGQPVSAEGGPPRAQGAGASEQQARGRADADAPATRDAEASRAPAPTTRDVYITAREREAAAGPAVAEGGANVGPTDSTMPTDSPISPHSTKPSTPPCDARARISASPVCGVLIGPPRLLG